MRVIGQSVVWTLLLVGALAVSVLAGEYYLSDHDAYWWYWGDAPNFELLIPSNADAYMETEWGGSTSLQVFLAEKGPVLIVGTMPGTDVDRAWNALSSRWAVTVQQARTTTSSTITTDKGHRAAFRVLEGRSGSGPSAMVRMVAFTRDNRLVYLMFVGNADSYSGDFQQYWLRAVHSFDWRS